MRTLPLLAFLLLAGCDAVGGGPRDLPAVDARAAVEVDGAADLAAARDAWAASGIADYEMRYEVVCFCPQRVVQVRVEGGRLAAAWVDGEPAPEDPVGEALTVDRLFEIALEAFADADRVSARVLPGAPFLYDVGIDYRVEMADEEVGYAVTGFERLD